MVLNPKASHNFAKVLLRNSKTDGVDADTLAQYAERMLFQPWKRPSDEALTRRASARRISTLTHDKAAAKNQPHALTADQCDGPIGVPLLALGLHARRLDKAPPDMRPAHQTLDTFCFGQCAVAVIAIGHQVALIALQQAQRHRAAAGRSRK